MNQNRELITCGKLQKIPTETQANCLNTCLFVYIFKRKGEEQQRIFTIKY